MMTPMDDAEEGASMVRMGVGGTQESSMIGSALPNFPNWMRGSASGSSSSNLSSSSVAYASTSSSSSSSSQSGLRLSDIRKEDLGILHDADDGSLSDHDSSHRLSARASSFSDNTKNDQMNFQDTFLDEGVVNAYGQGHRHGAPVYDDWGLPISNPSTYREGRNLCRPWLFLLNVFAIGVVIFILAHGGPTGGIGDSSDEAKKHYNWYGKEIMEEPETVWDFVGDELVGPIPGRHQAENRLVGYGHHVAMNAKGDRIAIARTSSGTNNNNKTNAQGEIYVYTWKGKMSKRRHNRPINSKNGKWRFEQVLTAELEEEDEKNFPTGQQHTPLAMSASGHRIAFTEGDHVFIFESAQEGVEWEQIAKVQSLDEEWQEGEQASHAGVSKDDGDADMKKDDNGEDDDKMAGPTRNLLRHDRKDEGENHFGKHLAFSHDGKTLAVLGFNHIKGGYIRVFQDETEDIKTNDRNEIRHLFEPTPDIFLEEVGDSLALSGDGSRLAIGIATSDDLQNSGTHNGMVQVFAIDGNDEWSRIGHPIFGDYPMEGFGGTVSLSEDGMVLAAGVAYGGGPVKVFEVVELDHFGKKWQWQQMGQTLSGTNHREHYGSQVRLDHNGAFLAIGAPGSPDMLQQDEPIDDVMEQNLHGKAYLLGYNRESNTWESKGEATSSYEGDAFGYSVAIDGDGDRVIVGAPFRIVNDEVNVGVVQVFGI